MTTTGTTSNGIANASGIEFGFLFFTKPNIYKYPKQHIAKNNRPKNNVAEQNRTLFVPEKQIVLLLEAYVNSGKESPYIERTTMIADKTVNAISPTFTFSGNVSMISFFA